MIEYDQQIVVWNEQRQGSRDCRVETEEAGYERNYVQLVPDDVSTNGDKRVELLILGAGGLGGVVAETAQMIGNYSKIAFLDDSSPDAIGRLDEAEMFVSYFSHAIPAVGDNQKRCELLDMLRDCGYQIPVIIHPTAFVSPNVKIGEGTIIRAMAAVSRDVIIGQGCLINMGALIDHGCRIGKGSHIHMGCIVRGEVEVQEMSTFEPNSVVKGIEK